MRIRRLAIAGGFLVLVAAAAVVLVARGDATPRGSVDATILLTGGSCRAHAAACAQLADGGSVVIFGPVRGGSTTDPPRHLIRMHGPVTRLSVPLEPGEYSLEFFIQPPWRTLLPDFGEGPEAGLFTVGTRAVHLGAVRPSKGWILFGD